ncbi:type II toxin-antitoxin system RelB/DinJ family antitoxin [Acinetobacter sp. B51(2017)]|uniref:type II toxin-antitoxin system RelB/DinJ family antitoxin n=1 Tax=Acinetobacter sp. B51(2017) TaxID=2060938 RepID=UPI000F085513|nr:type II toxin-antitoxin system RelB/DinJ family antitoxin [Acinetobacter sp. B51(2017)]
MRKTEVYQIRIGSEEKQQAFAVFEQLGISPAQAIRLFFKQVVLTQSIPFHIEQPRAKKSLQNSTAIVTSSNDQAENRLEQQDAELFATLNALLAQSKQP